MAYRWSCSFLGSSEKQGAQSEILATRSRDKLKADDKVICEEILSDPFGC